MKDQTIAFLLGIFIGALSVVYLSDLFLEFTRPYKEGQVDAMNGKIHYELKTMPDGTTQWERKK
jgi:hypothetical protein